MAQESDDSARSVKSRRDRLASLKAKHKDVAPATPPSAIARAARPNAGAAPLAGGQRPAINPQQKQMIGRIYRMLTQGADDGSGKVEGTPFLKSEVERLMGLLAARAKEPGAPGGKIAQSALRFIEAKDGEEAVGGASVQKLQMLAGRAESIRARAGRAPAAPAEG